MRFTGVFAAVAAALAISAAVLAAQRRDAFVASRDHPAINYRNGPVQDRVAALNRRIQEGSLSLASEDTSGYLRSVLNALEIPVESQLAVFSQASAQGLQTSLQNPRAIFFNDSVMVGWVRGADELEIAAQDPRQGIIFYTLSQLPADRKPEFTRQTSCLVCHQLWETLGVPGLLTQSVFPMLDDKYSYATGFVPDHRSPLNQRWGGWYVTGKSAPARHLGNMPVFQSAEEIAKGPGVPPRLESLAGRFDTKGFPSPYSDIVALMVINHQTHMTNLLTRLGWEARVAGDEAVDRVSESARDLVDYLLFVEEAPLGGRLEGSSGFAEKFSAQGPRDGQGRSLRQFDLERRLMRYPCSYMIYSEAFDALPAAAKDMVYRRMWQILSGEEKQAPYTRLSLVDRTAIVEILRETKKDLPGYFVAVSR